MSGDITDLIRSSMMPQSASQECPQHNHHHHHHHHQHHQHQHQHQPHSHQHHHHQSDESLAEQKKGNAEPVYPGPIPEVQVKNSGYSDSSKAQDSRYNWPDVILLQKQVPELESPNGPSRSQLSPEGMFFTCSVQMSLCKN